MARPRTNKPWIEARGRQFRTYWRTLDGKKEYLAFGTRADAEKFQALAGLIGLAEARAFVTSPHPAPAPAATPTPAGPEASATELELSRQVRRGQPVGLPFRAAVKTYEEALSGVDPTTARAYKALTEHYLIPYFGQHDVGLVLPWPPAGAPPDRYRYVTGWLTWMGEQTSYTNTGRRTTKPVAAKTIRNAFAVLHATFDRLLTDPMGPVLLVNPCQGVKPPQDDPVERVFLETSQLHLILSNTPSYWQPLLWFLVLTGSRWGEAAGLTVRHVHLDPDDGAPFVDIVRALKWVTGKGRVRHRLKTRASRRRLYIPHPLAAQLRPLVAGRSAEDFVFVTPGGRPLHHSNFTQRVLVPALTAARERDKTIPADTRVHAFRHTHAAILLSQGCNLKMVKDRLGHADITTTERVYGHLTREGAKAMVAGLDRFLLSLGTHRSQLRTATSEEIPDQLADPDGALLPTLEIDDTDELVA